MPTEKKLVDKFKLIETLGVMQKAVEDDLIDVGKVSFAKTPSGVFNCTVVYKLVEQKVGIAGHEVGRLSSKESNLK